MNPTPRDGGAGVGRVLDAAYAIGDLGPHRVRVGWRMRCPAHRGRSNTSLVLFENPDNAGLHCLNGCATPEVVEALGLTIPMLFDDWTPDPPGERTTRAARLRMRIGPDDPRPAEDEWANAFARTAKRMAELDAGDRYLDD